MDSLLRDRRFPARPMHSAAPLLLLLLVAATASAGQLAAVETCPMDLSYVGTLPWDTSSCQSAASTPSANDTDCCQTLLSLLGVGLTERLRSTSLFRLPSVAASAACMDDFAARLTAPPLSLPSSLVRACFGLPERFVSSNTSCAGIMTRADWVRRLGPETELDTACKGDLSGTLCNGCLNAGNKVSSRLTEMDGNSSHSMDCFYFTVTYAALVNVKGPEDLSTAECIFGLQLRRPTERTDHHGGGGRHSAVVIGVSASAAAVALIAAACLLGFYFNRRWRRNGDGDNQLIEADAESRAGTTPRPNTGSIWFGIKELERATGGFARRNIVGRGGFGEVYKGVLPDGSAVAVKKANVDDYSSVDDDDEAFRNEVTIISNLRHRNLVPLRGCCMAPNHHRYLVYDFMPNGSLHDHLFRDGKRKSVPPLSWAQRKEIILDVARGLAYLHNGIKPAIYHRDVKATNILLDGGMRARIADFGLARQTQEGASHMTTRIAGTHGYLAPEYALYGQLTGKSDVYSFGVVVLEVMSGRKALAFTPGDRVASSSQTLPDSDPLLITDWVWARLKAGRVADVLDPALLVAAYQGTASGAGSSMSAMERFVRVGVLCAHVMVALRPTIADALRMLEGDVPLPPIPERPPPLGRGSLYTDGYTFSISPATGPAFDSGEMLR